jgi:MFS family permease
VTDPAAAPALTRSTLWFGGLAFFTCYLGQTVLGVLQPTIASEFDLSPSEAQWVVNSFFLTLALFAAPGGRLGDSYGHRQVLLVALTIFAVASLSAAASQGFIWLILSIAVAGAGASTLYPSSAALIANRVPEESRGDALGKYSAIGVTVFIIGPLAAGLLTEVVSWRALFGLQCVVAIGLVVLGSTRVENQALGEPKRFDVRGLVVLMAGLSALLVSMMQALAWGWDSAATISLFLVGLAVLAAFARLELRSESPLLDVGLLRRRFLRGIVVAMFSAQFVLNGFLIYIATYFQHVLDFGPLLASVAMVPAVLLAPAFNIIAGRLTDRMGPRPPAIAGYLLSAFAFGWIAFFIDRDTYWVLLPGLITLSIAISPMFTSLLTGLANAVEAGERGDANALVLTMRWIGAATGTMVLGVILFTGADSGSSVSGDRYETAFTVLALVALAGALACAILLRDPAPRHDRGRPRLHPHF